MALILAWKQEKLAPVGATYVLQGAEVAEIHTLG